MIGKAMDKVKITLSGTPPKEWYHRFSARARLNGEEHHCVAGKYNFMIFNARGDMGLKIMKKCFNGRADGINKVRDLVKIHKLLFEEGIGPQVDSEAVEIEFDANTINDFLPNIVMPKNPEDRKWYGFWVETLKPEPSHFLDLYLRLEKRFAVKINKLGIFRLNFFPSRFINQIMKHCYKNKFHDFVKKLKILCLRNEIYRNAHQRIGTQTAINEFLNRQNYLYTGKGFKIFDVDASNGIGPIIMDREDLISMIKEGAQFPVKKRPTQYQALHIKDINLIGGRHSCAERLENMGFDPALFQNASLLDIGCNIGGFCLEAQKHGAVLTVGIDGNDEAIEAAKRLRDYVGIKNMKFITTNLDQDILLDIKNVSISSLFRGVVDQTHFDIVFALSIMNHVRDKRNLLRHLDRMTNKLLVLEGHADETEEFYRSNLLKYTSFSKVEFKGYSSDRSKRPILFCWK